MCYRWSRQAPVNMRRATHVLSLLAVGLATFGCGGEPSSPAAPSVSALSSPSPSPVPVPTSPAQYAATPVPFNVTQSRTLDILGWDAWPSAPTPSGIQFRWNAAIGKYEVLAPGYAEWSRLEALQDLRFGGPPHEYDVYASGETKLPFSMIVWAPPHRPPAGGFVGDARIFQGGFARAYFAFGIATAPGDVPVGRMMTCSFGEDEIGSGTLTFDFAAGTLSGSVEPFWVNVRYQLVQTSFARGATTFAATFGTDGILEGRFFGPQAANVAVRAKGAVTGIMTGVCEG